MKNLFFIISSILIVCIGPGEGFAISKSTLKKKSWLKDAPMSMELYQYLENNSRHDAMEGSGLKKIFEKHLPIGTSIDEALKIVISNHFGCGAGIFGENRVLMADASIDEQHTCAIHNLYLKSRPWRTEDLRIHINVEKSKVVSYRVEYFVFGPLLP